MRGRLGASPPCVSGKDSLRRWHLRAESCEGTSLRKRVCRGPRWGWAKLSRGPWGCLGGGQVPQVWEASHHRETLVS